MHGVAHVKRREFFSATPHPEASAASPEQTFIGIHSQYSVRLRVHVLRKIQQQHVTRYDFGDEFEDSIVASARLLTKFVSHSSASSSVQ